MGVDLAVCRGYPSLSFIRDIANKMVLLYRGQESIHDVILYFGDFDPSGINIPEALEETLTNVFNAEFSLERIALLQEHIDAMDLIPAPVKTSDSRASRFQEEHGNEVYELDAVDPNILMDMIRAAISRHIDNKAIESRNEAIREGRDKIQELMEENKISEMLESIREVKRNLDGGDSL
jgi:hypothetical protein